MRCRENAAAQLTFGDQLSAESFPEFGRVPSAARYGVAEGDSVAVGDSVGDVSPSVFLVDFFFDVSLGEADSSAVASVFFILCDVEVFFVVAAVEVPVAVVAVVSVFCAQETTKAVPITATVKDRNNFFIGM